MRHLMSLTAALALAGAARADKTFQLTGENTTVQFVGSKPDGKHAGGFKSVSGTASVGADPTTLKLDVAIDLNSTYSDSDKLTAHLKAPDFFNVQKYPTAKFVTTKVEKAGGKYNLTGDFTLNGVTKSVTFPATVNVADGLAVRAEFSIDRTQWGMVYGKGKVADEVALKVAVTAAK